MKVFELTFSNRSETLWVSGRTSIEALQTYLRDTDLSITDMDPVNDDISEVPLCMLKTITMTMGDGTEISLASWLKDNNSVSEIICGTMY